MVSKIAVIALVAVVAVPILLGYGLNINTNTYDTWEPKQTGKVDATEFLYNVTDTSKRDYTPADLYLFNSKGFYISDYPFFPKYESITSNKSSIEIRALNRALSGNNDQIATLSDEFVQIIVNGDFNQYTYYRFTFTYTDNTTTTIDHVKSMSWRTNANYGTTGTSATASVLHYLDNGAAGGVTMDNLKSVTSTLVGGIVGPGVYQQWHYTTMTGYYANISKGWKLNTDFPIATSSGSVFSTTEIQPDGICKDMLLSINLDSITDANYWMGIYLGAGTSRNHIQLIKETVAGTPNWYYQIYGDDERHQLYYDTAISSNTYQLYLDANGGEFRYTGAWSDNIGPRQPLITYPFSYEGNYYWWTPDALPGLSIRGQTPVMRIDAANVAAFEYRVIRDATYNPSTFKTNPLTVFSDLYETGSSLGFGGQTFTVSRGNITMGDGKQISLRNMELSSVPNGNGQYSNTINGIEVSVTNAPAQIVFNGDWRMTITTIDQEQVTKTVSKWEPGTFAWNGIDTDFKIAGLLASLGAFIGLGIYGRRSGAKVLPLLLVCGGAALMFLVMI